MGNLTNSCRSSRPITPHKGTTTSPACGIYRALTITGELTGILGPLFLLSPLALLAARKAEGRRVLLAGLVFGLPWLANHGSRFLIPALPFIALALAMVVNQIRGLAPALVLAHALISWPGFIQKRLLPATSWSFSHVETKAALRITPETIFLQQRLYEYPQARLLEDLTPPGSNILSAGNTAEAPTHRYGFVFSPRSLDHIRIQTTVPIYELHFQIPSEPNRRVTAYPQPCRFVWPSSAPHRKSPTSRSPTSAGPPSKP